MTFLEILNFYRNFVATTVGDALNISALVISKNEKINILEN